MAADISLRFLDEVGKNVNCPNVVIELELDSGTKRFGFHGRNALPLTLFTADGTHSAGGAVFAVGDTALESFSVIPSLKSVSSLQNKLDTKSGFSTRGQLTFVIAGRDNFQGLIRDNYLKNRRATRKNGFLATGLSYTDYASTFTGIITDWTRKGDELTVTVQDDLADASKKIPVENPARTQRIEYLDMHPVDIMTDMLTNRLGIPPEYVDSGRFAGEKELWLQGWRFTRVLTEPKEANEYLNELQRETNSFIVHDGEKVSFKVFAPPIPGLFVEEWTGENNILKDSLTVKSGYNGSFFNRVVIYYDYDESGSDGDENFCSVHIAADASSQDATRWKEVSTRTIKSRWIRTLTFTQSANIVGVRLYHVSRNNGAGAGLLAFVYDPVNGSTLRWTPPGGSTGEAVKVTEDGKFAVYGLDETKYVRVLVAAGELPLSNKSDTVTITAVNGDITASVLAEKILNRYRDPVAAVSLEIDLNNVAWNGQFIKPTDLKDVTTGEASEKGTDAWVKERVMLTSVRPDYSNHRVSIEAVETRMHRRYAFIAPDGTPDYTLASPAQRMYGFIGDAGNSVGSGSIDGYYVW